MKNQSKPSGSIWRWMRRLNERITGNYQRGIGPAKVVLLLTTTGRKTGLPRVTPLQYEEQDGVYYIGSARGDQADWFRNIQACSKIEVQIKGKRFSGQAEAITDPVRIADFFELRLKRHPFMMGGLMRLEGLPRKYTRADLERFAAEKAMVIIHPIW
jgi:deazaflavin-dependent oxidoreductase (nitroreductase family)